jgi:hypothetical protein
MAKTSKKPKPPTKLEILEGLIQNDIYAITFQTMGQYRTALLETIQSLKKAKRHSDA